MSFEFSHRWHDRKDRMGRMVYYTFFTNEESRQILGDVLMLSRGEWLAETWDKKRETFRTMVEGQRWVERQTLAGPAPSQQ